MTTSERAAKLVYVMGPSGAGKDTLLAYARARVDPNRVVFAHRYITRPADAGGENHVALSPAEFAARQSAGLFALSWESHGFMYGIGLEIDQWLDRGIVVVISGARAAWPTAMTRYRDAIGVVVNTPAHIRAARLAKRGREDEMAIRARLAREIPVYALSGTLYHLDNSGPPSVAGDVFVAILQKTANALAPQSRVIDRIAP